MNSLKLTVTDRFNVSLPYPFEKVTVLFVKSFRMGVPRKISRAILAATL